jgi:hypothetical protein
VALLSVYIVRANMLVTKTRRSLIVKAVPLHSVSLVRLRVSLKVVAVQNDPAYQLLRRGKESDVEFVEK